MRRSLIVAIAAVIAIAIAAMATAATKSGIRYEQDFTTSRPGVSTGFETLINSENTADATGKPRATRNTKVTFPRGFKFNTDVVPQCTAARLRARGPSGCPRKSRIGTGEASAVTGLSAIDPVENTVTAFNKRNGILFLIRSKPGEPSATLVLEGRLRGRSLTTPVPRLPQPTPFGEAILTEFTVDIKAARKGRGRNAEFFATSGPCPRSGRWVTTYRATYDDGRGNVTVKDPATCRRPSRR